MNDNVKLTFGGRTAKVKTGYSKEDLDQDWAKYPNKNSMYEEILKKVDKEDINKSWQFNVVFAEIRYTSENFPFVHLQLVNTTDDVSLPIIVFCYFDGKNFRSFVPKYGNMFNAKTHKSFQNNKESMEFLKNELGDEWDEKEYAKALSILRTDKRQEKFNEIPDKFKPNFENGMKEFECRLCIEWE